MLRWDWNKQIGTLEYRNYNDEVVKVSIFKGNALMIFIHELPNDNYQMFSFFCDKEHLKNLIKNEPDYFDRWNKITLWEVDNDTLHVVKNLYKVGVEINLLKVPF